MRRFSQRSALVTLSEINITPLLDLAFVLLIIFVITTPLLEQGINLKLPKGGAPDPILDKRDIRTVEISPQGAYMLNQRPMSLELMERNLKADIQANHNVVVLIRADKSRPWGAVAAVMDVCQRNGIRMSMRTEPLKP